MIYFADFRTGFKINKPINKQKSKKNKTQGIS